MYKSLTIEERKKIEKHIQKGLSCSESARLLGRSKNCVITEVRRAGGKEYSALKGQAISEKIWKHKYDNLKKRNQSLSNYTLSGRISNIEMQIEILHETIKELINERKNKKI